MLIFSNWVSPNGLLQITAIPAKSEEFGVESCPLMISHGPFGGTASNTQTCSEC